MSVTFALDSNSTPMVKIYTKDRWPNMSNSEFDDMYGYERDENGIYFYESAWPTVNWSNANARAILSFMGLHNEDLFGQLDADEIPGVCRNIIYLLNSEIPTLREDEEIKAKPRRVLESLDGTERIIVKGNCSIFSFGLDSEGTRERLEDFLQLLIKAQEEGLGIYWG